MKPELNLIEDRVKNNEEINIYSVKGFKWKEKYFSKNELIVFKNKLKIDLYLAKIAFVRGINEDNFKHFLDPKIKTSLPDPNILDDMEKATNKALDFIKKKKKIGILGDYDVDGSSATALMANYFEDINVD